MWLSLLLLACTSGGADSSVDSGVVASTACLGRDAHCERSLPELTVLMAHNAMANEADDFRPPNHLLSLTGQLDLGVRGFMLDVYEEDGEVLLCHAYCSLGSRPLADGLDELLAWLDEHPREVLQIIFERHAPASRVVDVFVATGADQRAFAPVEGWPSVQAMLDGGHQLVVFDQNDPGGPEWYLSAYDHAFDNDYAAKSVDDFDCDVLRGDSDNAFFTLNHFITDPVAKQEDAELANTEAALVAHLDACEAQWGRVVNHLALDFVSVGDGVSVVASRESGAP